jgi:sarcosine oxidase
VNTSTSRRNFLKGAATAGAVSLMGSHTFATPRQVSVIVVGAGAFGGWSALHLAQAGAKVTLLDAWGPGNSRASSGGETRTIRATYGPAHVLYAKMVAHALQLWQEYEKRWNLRLFFRSGALRMAGADDSYESSALPVLRDAGIRFEKLSARDCASRWPQMNFEGVSWSVYEPDSGFLAARRACEAVLDAFLKQGGQYRQAQVTPGQIVSNTMNGVTLDQGESLKADFYVFAPGPWLGRVFPFLAESITPTRQEVFFFGTPPGDLRFNEEYLPTWMDGGWQREPIWKCAFQRWPTRPYWKAGSVSTRTPPTTTSFWIAIPKRRTRGSWAEVRATASNTVPWSVRWSPMLSWRRRPRPRRWPSVAC